MQVPLLPDPHNCLSSAVSFSSILLMYVSMFHPDCGSDTHLCLPSLFPLLIEPQDAGLWVETLCIVRNFSKHWLWKWGCTWRHQWWEIVFCAKYFDDQKRLKYFKLVVTRNVGLTVEGNFFNCFDKSVKLRLHLKNWKYTLSFCESSWGKGNRFQTANGCSQSVYVLQNQSHFDEQKRKNPSKFSMPHSPFIQFNGFNCAPVQNRAARN